MQKSLKILLIMAICLYWPAAHTMHQNIDTRKAIDNALHCHTQKREFRGRDQQEVMREMNTEGFYCYPPEDLGEGVFIIRGRSPYQYHAWAAVVATALGVSLAAAAALHYLDKFLARHKPIAN